MPLTRVTITGADDRVDPVDLLGLSGQYPFVEFAMLISARHTHPTTGVPRFPSMAWMAKRIADAPSHPLRLAVHICGSWVHEIVQGQGQLLGQLLSIVERVQLNFAGREVPQYDAQRFSACLATWPEGRLIFQIGGPCAAQVWVDATKGGHSIVCLPLFDDSHGTGTHTGRWTVINDLDPVPLLVGYAGGLGPDNLAEELPRMVEAAGSADFWIDMETKVRTENGQRLDLDKVQQVLEIAVPYVATRDEAAD